MSGPISVKFEASEDTLVISEAVSSSFGFFRALFGGDFKESAERTVTLKEISRPIAGVVLQARNDVLRSVTRENVLDCVAAIDYLEPTEESKLLDDVGKKVLRNRWHGDQDLCRAMLDMAFKRPLVRCLLQRHSELMQACAPYMVKNAAHVASHWTASGEEGNDGSMKGFVIAMLTCLKEQIDTGTCVVRLEILKRFLTEATGTTNFNEAAAVIFETQKMADEREIGVDTPGSSCSTWSGGIGVQLGASSCTCPRPHGSISTRDRRGGMGDCLLPLSECRALEVYVDPSEAHPTQGVLCCSCSFGYSIPCGDNKTVDEDAAAVPMDHIDPHTDQCMPMFYLGMLGSEKTSGLNQAFPFDHHDDFDYRDGDGRRIPMVEVHDINATATIRDLPMRSLALHCLRLMILEGKWDQVGQMGAAITTEVLRHQRPSNHHKHPHGHPSIHPFFSSCSPARPSVCLSRPSGV